VRKIPRLLCFRKRRKKENEEDPFHFYKRHSIVSTERKKMEIQLFSFLGN
jgi:hypothetical protein